MNVEIVNTFHKPFVALIHGFDTQFILICCIFGAVVNSLEVSVVILKNVLFMQILINGVFQACLHLFFTLHLHLYGYYHACFSTQSFY